MLVLSRLADLTLVGVAGAVAGDVAGARQGRLQVGTEVAVYVSHHDSPACFYAQLVDDGDALIDLTQRLQDSMALDESTRALDDVSEGKLCAAK